MNDSEKSKIQRRIASAAGHLKGIEKMVQEDVYCIDIIRQVQAVQAALNKVNSLMLENHLQTCVTTAVRGEDTTERERMMHEIANVFEMKGKL